MTENNSNLSPTKYSGAKTIGQKLPAKLKLEHKNFVIGKIDHVNNHTEAIASNTQEIQKEFGQKVSENKKRKIRPELFGKF